MRTELLFILILIGLIHPALGQDGAATSAPILNPFNLKADELGSLNSYVNQVSGELNFPMNLASIPGPSLGINVSIAYNSVDIENLSKIWNRDAPTGTLGLGWSLDTQLIMVDNKQTGTREDDEFYLVEGGKSIKLICMGVSSGIRSYRTGGSFSNWIIRYTASSEKWEVIKDDGARFIYGDSQGSANAVQWTPRWGNWIGQSMAPGHQIQGLIWNLREVRTIWGDRVTYSYYVGNFTSGGSLLSTEYSILAKISDSWGHEVEFVHGNKASSEYQAPPGIVLVRSERFFLNKILVKTNSVLDHELQFDYSTDELGTSLLTKRLLKGIKKVTPAGTVESNVLFGYASASQYNSGALNKITFPTGGYVFFNYHSTGYFYQQYIQTEAIAPTGYAAPDVHVSDDYALVTWRAFNGGTHSVSPMHTIGRVVDWQGKWRTTDLGSLGYTKFVDEVKDYRVALSKDFFAVLTYQYDTVSTLPSYVLKLWRRSKGLSGTWGASTWYLPMSNGTQQKRVKLLTGNDFVCVSDSRGKIFRYTWNGSSWVQTTITETEGERWVTATNNYILSHDPNPVPDVVRIYYLDETRTWQTRTQAVAGFDSEPADTENEISNWYPSNSSAFVLANESNEMVIQWDENYNNIVRVDPGWRYQDYSSVYFDGTTIGLVTILNPGDNFPLTHNRALRRAGSAWIDSGEKVNGYGYLNGIGGQNNGGWDFLPASGMASFGPDMMIWNANTNYNAMRTFKYLTFNAGISEWNPQVSFSNTGSPYVNVGPDYFTAGGSVYFKQTNGYTLGTHALTGQGDIFPSSRKFIATDESLMLLRNGDTYVDAFLGTGKYRVRNSTSRLYRFMVGSSIVAVCSSGSEENFKDVTSITLRRMFSSLAISDYPITRVDVNDGAATRSTAYAYENPVLGEGDASVMYNKVTQVPGSPIASSKPFGHTDTYFYNTLNTDEVSSPFPYEASFPGVQGSNGHMAHRLLSGQPYHVAVFASSQPDTVSSIINFTNVGLDVYTAQDASNFSLYTAWPYKTIAKQDGRTEVVQYDFDPTGTHQMTRVTKCTRHDSGFWDQRYHEIIYAWQQYPLLSNLNMLTQTAYTRQGIIGGAVTSAAAIRWKQWPCSGPYCAATTLPSPYDQYTWRGTNSSSFTALDVGQSPSADWKPGHMVLTRDANTGMEIEVTTKGNERAATVLDNRKRTIASVTNAGLVDISYTSFEDGTSGLWTSTDGTVTTGDAKTGSQYLSLGTIGLSKPGLTAATTYRVTFWAKSSGGSVIVDGIGTVNLGTLSVWTLFQYKVTGLSSVNIRRSGATEVLLDEVRLHPAGTPMTTTTFHPSFGPSSQTDANNRTTYFDYDEFGQPKFVRDEDKNIIRHTFTNIKN